MGCDCEACLTAQRDYQREKVRAAAKARFPHELHQQLLDALGAGTPFKEAIADLDLSSRRVWGLAQHDEEWSQTIDEVLRGPATRGCGTELRPRTRPAACAGNVATTTAAADGGGAHKADEAEMHDEAGPA